MGEIKTKPVEISVDEYINSLTPEKRKAGCLQFKKLFDSVLKEKAVLWNNNMIGYGTYHYKSDRSTQEGDWPLTAFSPRAQNFTIYIMNGTNNYGDLLAKLGKHKVSSGSCIYINRFEDINPEVLKEIVSASVAEMKKRFNLK